MDGSYIVQQKKKTFVIFNLSYDKTFQYLNGK